MPLVESGLGVSSGRCARAISSTETSSSSSSVTSFLEDALVDLWTDLLRFFFFFFEWCSFLGGVSEEEACDCWADTNIEGGGCGCWYDRVANWVGGVGGGGWLSNRDSPRPAAFAADEAANGGSGKEGKDIASSSISCALLSSCWLLLLLLANNPGCWLNDVLKDELVFVSKFFGVGKSSNGSFSAAVVAATGGTVGRLYFDLGFEGVGDSAGGAIIKLSSRGILWLSSPALKRGVKDSGSGESVL